MSATNRHRRMLVTAAGLAMSGALMVACGHARGERAMNGTTTDTAAVSTTTPAESLSAATPSNPSAPAAQPNAETVSKQPSASSAAAGGNATASAATTTRTTRHHARKQSSAESTDYASSAVPDQTATTTAPKARRHRGAAESASAETANAETSKSATAKTDTASAASNAESANSGLSVSGANAMPAGATCTVGASSAGYESAYSASSSTPANVAVSTDVQSAKDQSKQDTAASHAQQPYDINRPNDAGSLSKTPTNTPDSVGGSLGHRDTSSAAVRRDTSANAYGNWSATASKPRNDSGNAASSMTPATSSSSSNPVPSTSVSSISASGTLPPCGWPAGAKGAFLNDAQVADAAIIANSVDSSISAGIAARTQNAAVREYAQMMVRDHTDANQQMASLVDRTKIAPAENDIAEGILRDTTGHTFAALTTTALTVPGQKVTPVTQPQAQPSKTNVPAAPRPAHIDTVEAPAMGGTGSNPAVKNSDTHVNVYDYNSPSSVSAKPDTTKVTTSVTAPTATSTSASSQPLTGDDKNYIDFMVQAHQQLLDALDNRLIPFAWNPDLKSALTAMRPVVQRHLDRARELQRGQSTTSQY